MKKVILVLAAVLLVVGFGRTAEAVEQWKVYQGDKVIKTLELAKKSVGLIDHIRKTIEINGKEVLLPAEATMIEYPIGSGSDGHRAVMYLNTTELTVQALNPGHKQDGDFFVNGYGKQLTMNEVISVKPGMLSPRQQGLTWETGGNERGLFVYNRDNTVRVTPGTKVEITVATMREKDGVRLVEVTKKTIDF